MTIQSVLADANAKMNKAVDVAKEDFAAIRTGRAHPSMFAKIMVEYYGTPTPLSQLATVQVPEARLALITPYDKGAMSSIEKAIRESDLGGDNFVQDYKTKAFAERDRLDKVSQTYTDNLKKYNGDKMKAVVDTFPAHEMLAQSDTTTSTGV